MVRNNNNNNVGYISLKEADFGIYFIIKVLVVFFTSILENLGMMSRQDNFILIRLHRVQYGENINKIDSQSVICSGS